ncbi:hypothetical protein [Chryseobacterium angstadtii]|uniref:hypothetical protein n=1 Tax=Chryseobacterium angstadtii TaxID=558151 RepID=UPI000A4ED0F5|nr:hypothetical protein [Chryseobacterium angstadtii]
MKKTILLTIITLFNVMIKIFAQVGINTPDPTATLDLVAKNSTGTTTNVDGLLIPRVDRERAQSMTAVPLSTMVYVNSIATGTQTGSAVNIDAAGYYYNNGTVWIKLNPNINIYNSDGSLTGNRTVTQGASTLAFTGTSTNAFSVDGTTFSVDAANDRIGIGTSTPTNRFHVVSTAAISNRFTMFDGPAGTNQFVITTLRNTSPLATGNYALLGFTNSGPAGGGAAWGMGSIRTGSTGVPAEEEFMLGNSLGGGYLERLRVTSSGNIGVATSTPQKLLHVNGALQVVNELNVGGNATTAGSAGTSGQVLTSNGAGTAPGWKALNTVSGTIASANYVQGTTALTVNQGTVADVPGVTITLTVPAGMTQTFLFTILGYAPSLASTDSQGAFYLLQDGVKISSAYTSMVSGTALVRLPIPVTFLKAVSLTAGSYTFKVQYSAWSGNQTLNYVPSTYAGYNGDTEAMLTKMQVLVYNN